MLKYEYICKCCLNRLEQKGHPFVQVLQDIIRMYSLTYAPIVYNINKRTEPIFNYLENSGYIVSQEFLDMQNIFLVIPKGNFRETDDERIFCFKDCVHDKPE